MEEAERLYRRVLAVQPGHFHSLHMLGVLAGQSGRAEAAVEFLGRAIAVRPRDAEALKNLGKAYVMMTRLGEAVHCLERAVAIDARLAEAHHELGYALEALGDTARAVNCYRTALKLAPARAETHNNLASLLMAGNATKELEALLRKAIALKPNYAEAHNNLANLLTTTGQELEAETLYRKAIGLRPDYAEAYSNLGNLLRAQGRPADAAFCYREAIAAKAEFIPAYWQLASVLEEMNEPDAAEECLRGAIATDPANARSFGQLGILLQRLGRFDDALTSFERAVALDPRYASAYLGFVDSKKITSADAPVLARMTELLTRDDLPQSDGAVLHFALGKAFDDLADYNRAMQYYDAGNGLKRQSTNFDRAAHEALVEELIATFTPQFFAGMRGLGATCDRPLFIVGMMRSGTTLLEQILTRHPDIAGGGELAFWGKQATALGPSGVRLLSAESARALCNKYLDVINRFSRAAIRVTDKMPHNFLRLGLIHLLFPKTHIIHCRRNPVDTCLSVYFTLFAAAHDFAYNCEDIVFFYEQYVRLMAHWRRVLPANRLLDVDYEMLVVDPEGTMRAIVAFLGLEWHDTCLRPRDNRRVIRTASAWQARQPIYRTSVERWRHYEPLLGALRRLLPHTTGSREPTGSERREPA
jgi:tetratricopeptide (TPR) repeat protein